MTQLTVTDNHHDLVNRYGISVSPFVVITIQSIPHSQLIIGFVTTVTRKMPHVHTLPEHLSLPPVFQCGLVLLDRYLLCVVFCRSLFLRLSFFFQQLYCLSLFWPLYCLSFFFQPLYCLSFFFWPLYCLSVVFWPLYCLSFFQALYCLSFFWPLYCLSFFFQPLYCLSFFFQPLYCLSFFFWPLYCLSVVFWPLYCLSFFQPLYCLSFFDLRPQPEMMGTLLICISKMATPGRLQFSYDLYRRFHS